MVSSSLPPVLTRLPALPFAPDRIIIGGLAQYIDTRGGWRLHGGDPLDTAREYLGLATRRALQRFVERMPEVITAQPLPDPDELNATIPKEEWRIGLDGQPDPPWEREFIVYLLDLKDLATLTFSNHTIGAIRAVTDLEDKWGWARAFFGDDVKPLIKLSEAPFPTHYGERKRPV